MVTVPIAALTKSSAKLSSMLTFLAKAAISRCAWANFLTLCGFSTVAFCLFSKLPKFQVVQRSSKHQGSDPKAHRAPAASRTGRRSPPHRSSPAGRSRCHPVAGGPGGVAPGAGQNASGFFGPKAKLTKCRFVLNDNDFLGFTLVFK